MKNLIFISLVLFLASCSSKVDNPGSDEEILKQISAHKATIGDLNKKIADLEKQLTSTEDANEGVAVAVQHVVQEPFNHYIEITGTAEAVNSAYISPEINGQVREILVKEGQHVKKGDLLIKINSSVTTNSINEIQTSLDLAVIVYEKQKQLWEKNIGSEIDYLQAKNNVESLEMRLATLYSQLDMAEIKAPISGIIDDISVKTGEMAGPGMIIIKLVNLDDVFINADVSEAYISNVKEGEKVQLAFPSYPDISMEVPVFRIGNIIKEANRTFKMQLKIKNKGHFIKPNILAKIRINDYSLDQTILIPSIIIKQDMKGSYVYIVDPENKTAKKTYIQTGRSYLDITSVSGGLGSNDIVIINGYNQVSTGTKVKFNN